MKFTMHCVKNFVMNDSTEVAFRRGKDYIFEIDEGGEEFVTDCDESKEYHYMNAQHINDYFRIVEVTNE